MHELMERCRGKWFDLLQTCGGLDRRHLSGRHGPCPMCGGKDRFRFTNWQNEGRYICNQCGKGDGAALLMRLKNWDWGELLEELERHVGQAHVQVATAKTGSQSQIISMGRLWNSARPIENGDPVDLYLRTRGLDLQRFPSTLRFHEACYHHKAKVKLPAMLARVDGGDGELSQIHQTFLSGHGGKADVQPGRLFHFGSFLDGSAVRLGKPNGRIGIAEGVETALSSCVKHGFAVWAALSAQLLMKWKPPDGVERVSVFGDNDRTFTGQSMAYALAHRLAVQHRGIDVEVLIPPEVGTDWNDVYANISAVPPASAPTATEDEIPL